MKSLIAAGIWLGAWTVCSTAYAQPNLLQPKPAVEPALGGFPNNKTLNVRLLTQDGKPVGKMSTQSNFMAAGGGGNSFSGYRTNELGYLTAPGSLRPGRYSAYISVTGLGAIVATDLDVAENGPGVQIRDLRLQPCGAVRVQVREEGKDGQPGRALGATTVSFEWPLPGGVETAAGVRRSGLRADSAQTRDGDGVAECRDLVPGKYRVTVRAMDEFLPLTQEVTVKAGETQEVDLVLTRDVLAELKVTVQDAQGKPFADETLTISMTVSFVEGQAYGAKRYMYSTRTIHTDEHGQAVLYPVGTGTWNITAFGRLRINATKVTVPREGGTVTLVAQAGG